MHCKYEKHENPKSFSHIFISLSEKCPNNQHFYWFMFYIFSRKEMTFGCKSTDFPPVLESSWQQSFKIPNENVWEYDPDQP